MQAKHTKGPWKVGRISDAGAFVVESSAGRICIVNFTKGKPLETEGILQEKANAKLIAAAPDLLEACKAMTGLIGLPGLDPARWDMLKAALKKAGD